MRNKEVFMHVDDFGDLYLYDVLLSFIYPRVFVCVDVFDCRYLFYEMSSDGGKDIWLVSKITKGEYFDLIDRNMPIQRVYEKKKSREVFSISKTYSETDVVEVHADGEKWIKMLPSEDVYVDCELSDNQGEETLREARESGNTTFDIKLFDGTDRHSIPQNNMTDFCRYFNSLIESIFGVNRRSKQLRVSTAPGSCIIRFSFPDQINLLDENDAINEMRIVNEVLSSDSISESLKSVKKQKKFVKSYSGLLNTIRKTNSSVQFTTAYPNSNNIKRVNLSNLDVKNKYEEVKDFYACEVEERVFCGSLIALDIKSRKFKLQTEDNLISGTVDEKVLEDSKYEIPKEYNARIKVEKFFDKSSNCTIEKYRLSALS